MSSADHYLYPARPEGSTIVHLAQVVELIDDVPTLRAVCPGGNTIAAPLELVPADEGDGAPWCPLCREYRDHLLEAAPLTIVDLRRDQVAEVGLAVGEDRDDAGRADAGGAGDRA